MEHPEMPHYDMSDMSDKMKIFHKDTLKSPLEDKKEITEDTKETNEENEMITEPRPVPTYLEVFATVASGVYNHKADVNTDYLSRLPAYFDDYSVVHLMDRFVGPTGALLPNPTSRNDSRGNPTAAILCTPYEGADVPSRCRHWPYCYYGQSSKQPCKFWHPTAICADYPNCRYTDEHCPYIHPKYFALVTEETSNLFGMSLDLQGGLQKTQIQASTALPSGQSRSSKPADTQSQVKAPVSVTQEISGTANIPVCLLYLVLTVRFLMPLLN
jgi:hypothetical protein